MKNDECVVCQRIDYLFRLQNGRCANEKVHLKECDSNPLPIKSIGSKKESQDDFKWLADGIYAIMRFNIHRDDLNVIEREYIQEWLDKYEEYYGEEEKRT